MFSRRVVLLSPGPELAAIRTDLVHPPLYYLLLQATTKLWGAGAVGTRALSLVCGILSIPLLWLVGSRLPDQRFAALSAAALLAFNQSHIFYSQEARSYAWYTFLALIFLLWLFRIASITERKVTWGEWAAGTALMIALVYTHYVGAVYVASAVVAFLVGRIPKQQKIGIFVCAAIAAVSFLPWLAAIAGVYRNKNGVGENLDWQGHPDFYSLKQVFASAIGIPSLHGFTTLVLVSILVLSISALVFTRDRARSAIVLVLFAMATLPPVIVFFLSRPPIGLPLFGLRHFLPTIPCMILLCTYGLDCLAGRAAPHRNAVALSGIAALLCIAAIPTFAALRSTPSRIPYNAVSQEVLQDRAAGIPVYATWFYGIGEPVNFYCTWSCVAPLPDDETSLPPRFVLLFRPHSSADTQFVSKLKQEGFDDSSLHYYTDGSHSLYGTESAVLRRNATQTPSPNQTH